MNSNLKKKLKLHKCCIRYAIKCFEESGDPLFLSGASAASMIEVYKQGIRWLERARQIRRKIMDDARPESIGLLVSILTARYLRAIDTEKLTFGKWVAA